MALQPKLERRRSPRLDLVPGEFVRFELRHRVQLLDISLSGALIACGVDIPVGGRGRLQAGLAALPFSADVVVKRRHGRPGTAKAGAVGAGFAAMDQRSREHLDRFLRKSSD